jgi:hypothetical protein
MQRREVTQDGVRLPRDGVAVDQGRHLHVGVHLAIGIGIGVVELPAIILAGVFQAELFEQEQHFLHVAGGLAAKDTDHRGILPFRLEHFQEQWEPVFRPKMRPMKISA